VIVEDQSEVIAFLSKPGTYGGGVERVERIDTHISTVFLAGERAYKLKHAVLFPYLDFSTLELRRRYCEAEVSVNRRTAPELYEGVLAVTREAGGGLDLAGVGTPVDWVVVMKRFDQDGLFDRLAERRALSEELMKQLADEIARFHAAAERRSDYGGRQGISDTLVENAEGLARHGAQVFEAEATVRYNALAGAALERRSGLLEARRAEGWVRRCHGDLHLRNICLMAGHPVLFDAIEFSDAFACIDVLYDLAFLLMDLEHRGLRALGNLVFNRYLSRADDVPAELRGLGALPLFLSCRAAVRAHTGADAAASQPDPQQGRKLLEDARLYHRMALGFLNPPPARLIAVGGLSGTGKSTLARALAPRIGPAPGAVVLRSDVIRKHLLGADELARLGPEAYTKQVTERVYATIVEGTAAALEAGHAVIADAVFAGPRQRERIEAVARLAGTPVSGLWLEAPAAVLEQRVGGRARDASDATVEILRRQLAYDVGQVGWKRIDAAGERDETLAAARAALGE
jgi:aminoglycoside phosphotransferase family enzyme/predicted kinase